MMKLRHIITPVFTCTLGIFVGASASWLEQSQSAYTEGRQSVLNRMVTVGDATGPCSLQIPLKALEDMVNAGVLMWAEACEDQTNDQ